MTVIAVAAAAIAAGPPSGAPTTTCRLTVAALHHALATEPVCCPAFRRGAGITGRAADTSAAQLRWWTACLERVLGPR